jgi:hypothetical protein
MNEGAGFRDLVKLANGRRTAKIEPHFSERAGNGNAQLGEKPVSGGKQRRIEDLSLPPRPTPLSCHVE